MKLNLRKRKPFVYTLGFDVMVTLTLVLSFVIVFLDRLKSRAVQASAQASATAADAEGRAEQAGKAAAAATQRASDAEGRATEAEGRATDAEQRADEAEGKLSAMQPGGPCDLMIVVDTTASMEPTIERLRKATSAICQWIPYLSKKCRIGVIGMRKGIAYEFPLREIKPSYVDGGRSQQELLRFLSSIEVEPSPTDHLTCIRQALGNLGTPMSKEQKQVCLLISDIGPCELEGNANYSASELATASRISTGVQAWTREASNRAFGSLYVGAETAGGQNHDWFESLSAPVDKFFYTDSSEVFSSILNLIKPQGTNR